MLFFLKRTTIIYTFVYKLRYAPITGEDLLRAKFSENSNSSARLTQNPVRERRSHHCQVWVYCERGKRGRSTRNTDRKPRFVQPLNLLSFNSAHGAASRQTRAIISPRRARMTLRIPGLSAYSIHRLSSPSVFLSFSDSLIISSPSPFHLRRPPHLRPQLPFPSPLAWRFLSLVRTELAERRVRTRQINPPRPR